MDLTALAGMHKERIREVVDALPDEIDIDQLIERLYLLKRLELAEEELAAGKVLDHEAVERRFATWLESSGPSARTLVAG